MWTEGVAEGIVAELKLLRDEIEVLRQEPTDDERWKYAVEWWNAAISEILFKMNERIAEFERQ